MNHMQSLRVVSLITRSHSHLGVKRDYGDLLSLLDVTWPKLWRPDPYLRTFNQAESSTEGRKNTDVDSVVIFHDVPLCLHNTYGVV